MDIYLFSPRFLESRFKFFDFASLYYIYMHSDKTIFEKYSESLDSEFLEHLELPLYTLSKSFTWIPEIFYKTIHENMVLIWEIKP